MGQKIFEEIMATYSPSLKKNINLCIPEVQWTPMGQIKRKQCPGQTAENQRYFHGL